ncbi:MAG TPA: lysophospholipid acyltransferase family protein [Methanocorpusculum sp.]|nr:lysophospholipid acyltransferase family protein [Methanocorpusculum sp.]
MYIKHLWWYKLVYKFARFCIIPFIKYGLSYQYEVCKPKSPTYLIFCNHTTLWDHLLIGAACPQHMFFVAGEHLFRKNWIRIIANCLVKPIIRKKGVPATEVVENIKKTLAEGANVWMAPEGMRSINGETAYISSATGKLVKESRMGMITYRIHGGYLRSPRWAAKRRNGPLYGEFVAEYTQEQLARMSIAEINEIIRRDLYVNAFNDQKISPSKYTGTRLAEYLETVLYVCPHCRAIAKLHSKDDHFFCDCGFSVKYSEYGLFKSEGEHIPPFSNIADWDKWQRKYLEEQLPKLLKTPPNIPIVSDHTQQLYQIKEGKMEHLATGRFAVFSNRFEFGYGEEARKFLFSDIAGFAISLQMKILFSCKNGKYYEVQSDYPRSAIKYMVLYRYLTGKPYY